MKSCSIGVRKSAEMRTDNYFDTEEFTKAFLAFEQSNSFLFDIRVKGHLLWDYIRYAVFYQVVYARMESNPLPPSPRNQNRWGELIRNLWYLLCWSLQKKKFCEIFFINYDRNRWFDGKFVNIHTYAIVDKLHKKYRMLFVDPTSLVVPVEKNYACGVLRSWPFEMIDRLKAHVTFYSAEELTAICNIANKLEAAFHLKIDVLGLIKTYFSYQRQCYKRYLQLFKIYQPRLVMYIDTAGMKGVIEAAHTLGIPTVDLQHSLISHVNILYNYPKIVATKKPPTISDYILTFGEFWHSEYRLPVKKMAVGFPLFEIQENTPWKGKQNFNKKEKNILIISDMFFSKSSFIDTTITLSKQLPDYIIYYKLRPEDYQEWKLRYPKEFIERENVRVIDSDQTPLYEYFKHCSFQVGINSTAIYEGLTYGLTTFILKRGWYEEMKRLYEQNYVFLVSEPKEIAEKIIHRELPKNQFNMKEVLKPDSLQNMQYALEKILKENDKE